MPPASATAQYMEIDNSIFFAAVEERLREGGPVTIVLRGTSMQPTLNDGDRISIAPLEEDPQVGDVVLFRYAGQHLLHRVIAIDGDRYTMQGDNCYGTECASRSDIVARLVAAHNRDGRAFQVGNPEWERLSQRSLRRNRMRNTAIRLLGRHGRRRLRPWYFAALALLMWAPINGLGVPLDNYILGLRLDHLLHASVYIPIAIFLMDLAPRRRWWLLWIVSCIIGLLTEGGQWILPYRGFDINDMVANLIGVTLGWTPLEVFLRHIHKK